MKYYLLDTSFWVWAVQNGKNSCVLEKDCGQAFLYMPQSCIPEVFNTFAKLRYANDTEPHQKIDDIHYESFCKSFEEHIHERKIIYIYDLHRYHNLNAHKIYEKNYLSWNSWDEGYLLQQKNTTKKYARPMSGLDIILLSMALELKIIHPEPHNQVIILTRDDTIIKVVNDNLAFFGVRAQKDAGYWHSRDYSGYKLEINIAQVLDNQAKKIHRRAEVAYINKNIRKFLFSLWTNITDTEYENKFKREDKKIETEMVNKIQKLIVPGKQLPSGHSQISL